MVIVRETTQRVRFRVHAMAQKETTTYGGLTVRYPKTVLKFNVVNNEFP